MSGFQPDYWRRIFLSDRAATIEERADSAGNFKRAGAYSI
jgi:hypothetical protein